MSDEELAQQLAKYDKFLYQLAHYWKRKCPRLELEELHACAVVGFCEARLTYDPAISSFTTHATWRAKKRILEFIASEIKLSKIRQAMQSNDVLYEFHSPMEYDEVLSRMLDALAAEDRQVFSLVVIQEQKQCDVAYKLGLSKAAVSRSVNRSMRTLSAVLQKTHTDMRGGQPECPVGSSTEGCGTDADG